MRGAKTMVPVRVLVPIRVLVLVGWAFTIAGCEGGPGPSPAAHDAGPPVWSIGVDAVSGKVLGCEAAGRGCKPLAKGERVARGSLVSTAMGSGVVLRLDAGTTAALSDGAEVSTSAEGQHGLGVVRGTTMITRLDSAAEPLKLLFGDEPARIDKGTTLAARAQAADRLVVTVHRGQLDLWHGASRVVVRGGESVHLVKGKPPDRRAVWAGALPPVALEGLPVERSRPRAGRGIGRVTARVPGREEVVSGVTLKSHQVRVAIRDGYARTEVEEELHNETDRVLEGRYVFPVPPDASISRVALWVDDELVEGELLESKRAAGIFKGIVDDTVRPRDPALLEWVGGGDVSLKIFPMPANKSRKVILAYNQALPRHGSGYRYVYPMAQGSERATSVADFGIAVSVGDTRAAVQAPATPGWPATVTLDQGSASASYVARSFTATEDFVLEYERAAGHDGPELSAYVPKWGEFALPGSKAAAVKGAAAKGAAVKAAAAKGAAAKGAAVKAAEDDPAGFFALRLRAELPEGVALPASRRLDRAIVIDTSTSQTSETLQGQRDLAAGLLRQMDPDERFVLLACATTCEAYPEKGLVAATAASIDSAVAWLDKRVPGGATDVAGALVAAGERLGKSGAGQLVYLGDGSPSAGPLSADRVAARVEQALAGDKIDVRLLAAGRSIDRLVLDEIARRAGGTVEPVVEAGVPLGQRIAAIALSLRQPVVRGAKVNLPQGFDQIYPEKLPNLALGSEVTLVGKLLALQPGEVVLTGELGGKPYRLARALKWTEDATRQNPLVPRLWAHARIGALEAGGGDEAKKEIVALSKRYRVMSRLTSFIVLENDAMFSAFGIQRTVKRADEQSDHSYGEGPGAGGGLAAPGASARAAPADGGHGKGMGVESLLGELMGPGAVAAVPQGKVNVGGAAVSGGRMTNVAPVVARMRGRFRACYQQGLRRDPTMRGSVTLVLRVGAQGEPISIGGGGSGSLASIVPCLKAAARAVRFQPPEGGVAVVSIPITFVPGEMSVGPRRPSYPTWSSYAEHFAGNDTWMAQSKQALERASEKHEKEPKSRAAFAGYVRQLVLAGRFADALVAARGFVALDPDLDLAHELLGHAAAANGDKELALAAVSARVELQPASASNQIRAARAHDAAGHAAAACAHWRAYAELRPADDIGKRAVTRCDGGQAQEDKTPGGFEASFACAATEGCPLLVVIGPRGEVFSPWTPSTARASATSVALGGSSAGLFRTLLVGGSKDVGGKVTVRAADQVRTFEVDRQHAVTVAVTRIEIGQMRYGR